MTLSSGSQADFCQAVVSVLSIGGFRSIGSGSGVYWGENAK
ncbi:hypothetical protein [Phocaeicola sartorii]|nr:hypothetical protein [Phocaeicola sartorii]